MVQTMQLFTGESPDRYKFAFWGPPGTGKTWIGIRGIPPVIYLTSERQGMEHVRGAARYYEMDLPHVLFMESLDDYKTILKAFNGKKDQPFEIRSNGELILSTEWPNTVIIDSLTDALNKIKLKIINESPPDVNRIGLRELTIGHWGEIRRRCEEFIWRFRDIDANVVFLCLNLDKDGDRNNSRYHGPDLPMANLSKTLVSSVNICAQTIRFERPKKDDDGNVLLDSKNRVINEYHYAIKTRGKEYEIFKTSILLDTYEKPNLIDIIKKLKEE